MLHLHFDKAALTHKELIFDWLDKPHVQEFWDNSPEHRQDIFNFIEGHAERSNYFDGIFTYWIGFIDSDPFCFVMT